MSKKIVLGLVLVSAFAACQRQEPEVYVPPAPRRSAKSRSIRASSDRLITSNRRGRSCCPRILPLVTTRATIRERGMTC